VPKNALVDEFCVLVTSAGNKIPLLTALRKSLNEFSNSGRLIGADANPECFARYFVDQFLVFPRDDELDVKNLIKLCQEKEINVIIPTRDAELIFYARHKMQIEEAGISVFVSSAESIELCVDKLLFADRLKNAGFSQVIETSKVASDIDSPSLVVKERFGAGSRKLGGNLTRIEAEIISHKLEQPIYQPWCEGREYSIDLYRRNKGDVLGGIVRSRDLIVNGESQITTTCVHHTLETLCCAVACRFDIYGHMVFQAIVDECGDCHLIECNCRIGGASTLSIAAGLCSFFWFFCEVSGFDPTQEKPFVRPAETLRQVRYNADLIIPWA